jgi:tripartite-type tricarboxylate transporter receptor subunit TctC
MSELVPGFEVVGWYGVMAPPNLPKPLVSKLHGELVRIVKMNDIRDRILADGAEPVGSEPEAFRQYLLADLAKWAKLVKESGAKLD